MEIPRRPLGTSGVLVSALGLGGYHLALATSEREGIRIVHAAVDAGVTFMDNAWEYHDGQSEQIMGLRYAMSLPVMTTVSGIDSMRVLKQNLKVAAGFKRMSPRQMEALRVRVREKAEDGRFELYKTTAKHEGPVGRKQHGFPVDDDLCA